MKNKARYSSPAGTNSRSGVTLSEVLISTALLSLGVIGLAVLFPISVLKSIQATQLTNGTNLRYNAETFLDTVRSPVHPLNSSPVDFPVTPPTAPGVRQVLVLDPIGWLRDNDDTGGTDNPGHWMGNDGAGAPVKVTRRIPGVNVDSTTAASVNAADTFLKRIATLPDSWVNHVEGFGDPTIPPTATTFTFTPDVDLVDVTPGAGVPYRIVFFHTNGKISESRPVTQTAQKNGQEISWTDPLPNEFVNAGGNEILKARLEYFDPRYSWMITVRKSLTSATGVTPATFDSRTDVVVFFNRQKQNLDEQVYSNSDPARPAFVRFKNTVVLDYSSTPDSPPFLKKGAFIFDVANGFWYRIVRYVDDTSAQQATIYLDRQAEGNSNAAILMKGIIEVYPIDNQAS